MKILVLSDSHSSLRLMRRGICKLKPDAVVHLGDYYEDAEAIQDEFSHIVFHMVGGNCDRYRGAGLYREMLCYGVCGVMLFMVHGHNHHVKNGLYSLLQDARSYGADAVLYGHTHIADYHREEDGLWVLNPGSCSSDSGSVGLIETDGNKITACRIFRQAELEEFE